MYWFRLFTCYFYSDVDCFQPDLFWFGALFGVNSFMVEMVIYLDFIHLLKKPQRGESFITVKSSWELLTSIILFVSAYIYMSPSEKVVDCMAPSTS